MNDLANEIDGIADFGITVCLIDAEKMSGRQKYIDNQSARVRRIVDSITSCLKEATEAPSEHLQALEAELLAGSFLLVGGFNALQDFRKLPREMLRVATESLRVGWEAVHQAILQVADAFELLEKSWYAPILDRRDSCHQRLQHLFDWLLEACVSD